MITMFVSYDIVLKEYEKESHELINILRTSNSKYKDMDISKINWLYSFSYFKKKGENTPEYFENLFKMPFEERLVEEIKKVRVNLALSASYFYVSDRVLTVSESIKKTVEIITMQKIVNEQSVIGDVEVLSSIPGVKDEIKPISLQEQLKNAIDIEDYEEAARIRDKMKVHE